MKPRFDERPQSIGEVRECLKSLTSLTPDPSPKERGVDIPRENEETVITDTSSSSSSSVPKVEVKEEETEKLIPQPIPKDEETELMDEQAKFVVHKNELFVLFVTLGTIAILLILLCVWINSVVLD